MKNIDDIEKIFSGELIICNHETLTIFGYEEQRKLRKFTKSVADILIRNNSGLEYMIKDVLDRLDKFQLEPSRKSRLFHSDKKDRQILIKRYYSLLSYIEQMTLTFKLQEVQLAKENYLFEQMDEQMGECQNKLDYCITNGENTYYLAKQTGRAQSNDVFPISQDNDLQTWIDRLERRLDDLKVSKTVLTQSQTQMVILKENNRQILEKLAAMVTQTIPVWKSQVTALLGIVVLNSIKSGSTPSSKISYTELTAANSQFWDGLNELSKLEMKDGAIRTELERICT